MTVIAKYTPASIEQAIAYLQRGEVVAVPTETVYGLVADATSEEAVTHFYNVKGRAAGKPSQILVSGLEVAEAIATFPAGAAALAKCFWPGALTLVIPAKAGSKLAESAMAENGTIGIRVPAHEIPLALLKRWRRPVIASSANRAGEPVLEGAGAIAHVFQDTVGLVIADEVQHTTAPASTVVDATGTVPVILRQGAIDAETIRKVWSAVS